MEVRVGCHGGFLGGVFDSGGASDGECAPFPSEDSRFEASESEFVAGWELGAEDLSSTFQKLFPRWLAS